MEIDEIFDKLDVSFPKEVSFTDYYTVLRYITKSLPGSELEFTTSQKTSIKSLDSSLDIERKEQDIYGNITRRGAIAGFKTIYNKESGNIKGLWFDSKHGHDYLSHSKEQRMIWDDVKTVVDIYFEERK